MTILRDVKTLLNEQRVNKNTIAKLLKRNKEIDTAIKTVSRILRPSKAVTIDPDLPDKKTSQRAKPSVIRYGIFEKIIGVLASAGGEREVLEITIKLFGPKHSNDEYRSVQNACAALTRRNRLVRTRPGTYKIKTKTPKTSTAKIGHDTRVKRVDPVL